MKAIFIATLILLFALVLQASEKNKNLNLSCQDYNWSDVESLVAPYLDDVLYTALVMQGQSSNYKVSEAARQANAMDETLPDVVKKLLQALIKADC